MENEIADIDRNISISKWSGFITASIAVILAFYPSWWFGFRSINYNEFGDYVGGVSGSLLSLAAMMFLYMTFLIQRKQIIIQKKQLDDQEIEHKRTESRLNIRDFEERFFRLIQMLNENLKSIDLRKEDDPKVVVSTGKDSFKTMYNKLSSRCNDDNVMEKRRNNRFIALGEVIEIFRIHVHPAYENDLDSYFKYLGLVLEYVDNSTLVTDKTLYYDLIKDQLSTYEQLMIHYICKVDDSHLSKANARLKKLIIKHNILEHVDQNKFIPTRD